MINVMSGVIKICSHFKNHVQPLVTFFLDRYDRIDRYDMLLSSFGINYSYVKISSS